jgi:hypothetical protein
VVTTIEIAGGPSRWTSWSGSKPRHLEQQLDD